VFLVYVTITNFISLGVVWTLLSKSFLGSIEGFSNIFFHILWLEDSCCSIYDFIEMLIFYLRLVNLYALVLLKSVG
jgi:hypothetical protein